VHAESEGELQCPSTFRLAVLGPVDHPHATTAEVLESLLVRNRLTDEGGHDNFSTGGRMKKASAPPHRRVLDALSKS
jgi:hypothetical protein